MIKSFLFFFTLLVFSLAIGQDRQATLILKDNKTITGFGEIKKNKIYFKSALDKSTEIFTEENANGLEFTGYRLPEKYIYVFHGKKNEAHLMEVILEGSVELYKDHYYTTKFSPGFAQQPGSGRVENVEITSYYIKKTTDNNGTLVTMNFKKIGQTFFSDCEDLMSQINEEEFSQEEEIIDLVKYYNRNCKE